jgi:hypothetical protein
MHQTMGIWNEENEGKACNNLEGAHKPNKNGLKKKSERDKLHEQVETGLGLEKRGMVQQKVEAVER